MGGGSPVLPQLEQPLDGSDDVDRLRPAGDQATHVSWLSANDWHDRSHAFLRERLHA